MIQCLIGLFIGTNQLVSQAIVTELSAPEKRSKRLLFLMLAWYVGALTAVAAEFLLLFATTIEGSSWHALYALPACLCFVSLLLHQLMQAFHPTKAAAIVKTVVPSLKPYRKALLFCFSFRPCQTLPVTAVMFYSPIILESVTGNLNLLLQVALIYTGFLAGTLPILKFGDRLPTRWVLVGTFAAMATGLGGISCDPSAAVLGICFGLYALVYGMQSPLDFSRPNQLFPTAVRATTVGIVLAVFVLGTGIALAGFFIALWPHIAR